MATSACEQQIQDCLAQGDLAPVCTCEEAKKLRIILFKKIQELTCNSCAPIEINGVKYERHSNILEQLRRMLQWTVDVCKMEREMDGPVFETVYQNRVDTCCNSDWGYDDCGCYRARNVESRPCDISDEDCI